MQNKFIAPAPGWGMLQGRVVLTSLISLMLLLVALPTVSAEPSWWDFTARPFIEDKPVNDIFNKANYNSILMMFYPVEDWELEVCTRDLTSLSGSDSSDASMSSMSAWFDGVAVAVSASRYNYTFEGNAETIYYMDWFVQSASNNVTYSPYLRNSAYSGQKYYIQAYSNKVAGIGEIASGINITYSKENYDIAGIEYRVGGDADAAEYVETRIVYDEADYD